MKHKQHKKKQNMKYKNIILDLITILVIGNMFFWAGMYVTKRVLTKDVTAVKEVILPICEEDSSNYFTVKDFALELLLQEIKHPDIVLRQACLESGFFTSLIWRTKNNPFGYFYNGDYVTFNDWKSAISYCKTWQDKYYKNDNENYYNFLERVHYAEDSNYVCALKNIDLNNLRNLKLTQKKYDTNQKN